MPKKQDYFAGKTIIITGAASGIGRAAALIFAREKANVVCADIDEDGLAKTAETINAIGSQVLALTIDVTRRAAVENMVELAVDGFGSVQFLFNSAGAAIRRAKFLEIDDDLFDRTFDLNVKGTLYPMQAVLPHMLANKFGVIVNMGSMDHRRGARIRHTRDPRHVDFTRPREDTVSGGGQQLGGTGSTFSCGCADETF